MKRINVLDFGAHINSETLSNDALNKAIDVASKCHGMVYFPKGTYTISSIRLKENTILYIPKGTTINGSLNFDDFFEDEKVDYPLYQDESHSFFDCSMFIGKNVSNIKLIGHGTIDMRSVWDIKNRRNIVNRGCKAIALKECKNVEISGIRILNATDLAVYYAGCDNVHIHDLKLRTYIDGISPDSSRNSLIENCNVESGDDGIVFKSSYTLNRFEPCENITVRNCTVVSRCNAIKFGTESNTAFRNIKIDNIDIKNTRITGISIESVDGAEIENIEISNIRMRNVNAPIFIHLGKRLRGPEGIRIGSIKNITLRNIDARGPYHSYKTIPWNYQSYLKNDVVQYPWIYDIPKKNEDLNLHKNDNWQFSQNICGLKDRKIENITLENITLKLFGGVHEYSNDVPEEPKPYPEVFTYGKILPSYGIYFRHIDGLTLKNINISLIKKDKREKFVFDDVTNLKYEGNK